MFFFKNNYLLFIVILIIGVVANILIWRFRKEKNNRKKEAERRGYAPVNQFSLPPVYDEFNTAIAQHSDLQQVMSAMKQQLRDELELANETDRNSSEQFKKTRDDASFDKEWTNTAFGRLTGQNTRASNKEFDARKNVELMNARIKWRNEMLGKYR